MVTAIYRRTQQPKSVGLVSGLAATRRSVCIHQMNRVNSCNGFGRDNSTISISMCIIVIIMYLGQKSYTHIEPILYLVVNNSYTRMHTHITA